MKQICLALAALMLAACGGAGGDNPVRVSEKGVSGGPTSGCNSRAYPEIGGPFSLVSEDGVAVTEADFAGAPTMVFFGFTYCPDVCPAALVTMKQAYAKLPEGVEPPQTVLISVDPERDTPDALANYTATKAFPENTMGLTGSEAQVRAAADAFIADYSRIELPESVAGYTMDHTALIYLMDANWQLKTFFTHEDTPDTISACLASQLG